MHRDFEIAADMVLSINGEDLSIKSEKDTVTITPNAVRSGLRALLALNDHPKLLDRSSVFNSIVKQLGLTVYAQVGFLKLAVLGLKKRSGALTILVKLARLARMVGAV
jgi:hypothetical protein